jgi:Uma2 family endonuclease
MTARARRSGLATIDDFLAIPGDRQGFEILDGEVVEKVTSAQHGGAQFKLGASLDPYNRRGGGGEPGGWVFGTEVAVAFERHQICRPDVAGWRRERLPALPPEPVLTVTPDWACEILSPSNARNDLVKKKRVYHRARVGHYWILDPTNETLTVYRYTPEAYLEVAVAGRGERLRPEPFSHVELSVSELLGLEDEAESERE